MESCLGKTSRGAQTPTIGGCGCVVTLLRCPALQRYLIKSDELGFLIDHSSAGPVKNRRRRQGAEGAEENSMLLLRWGTYAKLI